MCQRKFQAPLAVEGFYSGVDTSNPSVWKIYIDTAEAVEVFTPTGGKRFITFEEVVAHEIVHTNYGQPQTKLDVNLEELNVRVTTNAISSELSLPGMTADYTNTIQPLSTNTGNGELKFRSGLALQPGTLVPVNGQGWNDTLGVRKQFAPGVVSDQTFVTLPTGWQSSLYPLNPLSTFEFNKWIGADTVARISVSGSVVSTVDLSSIQPWTDKTVVYTAAGVATSTAFTVAAGDVGLITGTAGITDTINSSITTTAGTNIDNLTLTGAAAINGTGNALDNVITGNAAANTLSGLAGNDTLNGGAGADNMIGGDGNDTYVVDNAADITTETNALAAGGIDLVQSSVTRTLSTNIENLTLTGAGTINGTGNALANVITGNTAGNILSGLDGNDTLIGNTGNDVLDGGAGNDRLVGGYGHDNLTGGAGADLFRFDTALSAALNVDSILDFSVADDTIQLNKSGIFTAIPTTAGVLAASAFWVGTAAHDADDRIFYNATNGVLYYDADGNGAGVAVQFAILQPSLALTNADFIVF
jgi:Ca2+-binding RTX toxin-like protein